MEQTHDLGTTQSSAPKVEARYDGDYWADKHRNLQLKTHRRQLQRLVGFLVICGLVSFAAGALFHPHIGARLFAFFLLGASVVQFARAIMKAIKR